MGRENHAFRSNLGHTFFCWVKQQTIQVHIPRWPAKKKMRYFPESQVPFLIEECWRKVGRMSGSTVYDIGWMRAKG